MLSSKSKLDKKEYYLPIRGIFQSFSSGVIGFFIIFCSIIISKVLFVITDPAKIFSINLNDIIISSWGFLIFSFIVFAVNNKRSK